MDLIERYLASVRHLLPKQQRDDIVAELRDVLTGRREEKAAELGRALTTEEDEQLLREFGHPVIVAGRYRKQQSLIGPELYPVYTFVLRLVLSIVLMSALVVGVVATVASSAADGVRLGFAIAWNGAFTAVGAITIIFAAVQRYSPNLPLLKNWRARDLPTGKAVSRRVPSVVDHVAGIVVNVLFILWWIHVLPISPYLPLPQGQTLHLGLAPIWQSLYLAVLGLNVGAIAVHAVKLTRAGRGWLGHGLDLALQIGILAVAGTALHAGHWVVVTGTAIPAQVLAKVDQGVDVGMHIALIVIVWVAVIRMGYDFWQLIRGHESVTVAST